MPPQATIRGYELLERIGAGAESVIYRAKEDDGGRIVAIKHLAVDLPENYKYLRHVCNEYKVLRTLHGGKDGAMPGVVAVHRLMRWGFLRRRKQAALVMQHLEGMDMRRERRYPLGQMVHIITGVAKTLALIHARGYIHGDLKPENIVVDPSGTPTMVDFGFSCPAGSNPGTIRGTRDYMAPEQVDMKPLTERTDVYNLGATMYFLFAGRHVPALIAQPGDETLFISGRGMVETPSLQQFNASIPAPLDTLVLRCVKKDPLERPSCAEEVREGLENVIKRYFS